jgi:predicted transcriptional regulator
MKTAISIPDDVFENAERTAKKLGVSRSELYANAVAEFIERYRREGITEKLNDVYGPEEGAASSLDPNLNTLQLDVLTKEDW